MENNVTTLETSKQLKAAGFPQNMSAFAWYKLDGVITLHTSIKITDDVDAHILERLAAALDAQEIADQLPKSKRYQNARNDAYLAVYYDSNNKVGAGYEEQIAYEGGYMHDISNASTMAEALAALWLALNTPGEK